MRKKSFTHAAALAPDDWAPLPVRWVTGFGFCFQTQPNLMVDVGSRVMSSASSACLIASFIVRLAALCA
jgi:hypothetical protein